MIPRSLSAWVWCALLTAETPSAQFHQRIRDEATKNSQIAETLHNLTDVWGPRLTGSPRHESAAQWARDKLAEWGLANAALEPWDFGRPGWENERVAVHMLAPGKDTLVAEALAWTPGTRGRVRAAVVRLPFKTIRAQEEAEKYFAEWKDKVRGKIVFTGPWNPLPVDFQPRPKRIPDADIQRRFDPVSPQPAVPFPKPPAAPKPEAAKGTPLARPWDEQLSGFLVKNKARVQMQSAALPHGLIRAFQNRTYDIKKSLPVLVLRHEDFGRIQRLLEHGRSVELEVEIINRIYPAGKTSHNVVAEIPGTDKKEEIVMLGGHLDSWHAATGATDNAVGCAMMMEAVRILKTLNLEPRRTIRIALWSGEEQGLLGSKAYVAKHFGTFEKPGPEADRLVAYFNIDAGTGRPRGISVFGPASAAAALRSSVKPFGDLGVFGAVNSRLRAEGGSDHTSFNVAGFSGISIAQDPIEYFGQTWHTNVDTYERIVPEDVQRGAIVIAAAVYDLASGEERLPRFSKDEMPAPPRPRETPPPAAPLRTEGTRQ